MQEQWTRWEPIKGLAGKYYIDFITDSLDEGFKVILTERDNEKKTVHVIFKDSVDCYTSTNESYINHLIFNLDKDYGPSFYGDWTFFKITNSDYLKRLSVISSTISDDANFTHFVLLASDSMLDIITNYEPEIKFIDLP